MSRRFGRNQRRRAREALVAAIGHISNLQMSQVMDRGMLQDQSQKIATFREWFERFAGRVGEYALVNDVATEFEAEWLKRGVTSFKMDAHPEVECAAASVQTMQNISMEDASKVFAEVMMLLDVDVIRSDMSRDMHCLVKFGEHRVGYAISEHALRSMGREEFVRRVTPEIADFLADELKRLGVR